MERQGVERGATQGQALGWGPRAVWLVAAAALVGVGCASGPDAAGDGSSHRIPTEVSDHTVESSGEASSLERPQVDVRLEPGALQSVDSASYEASLEERAVRCYRRALERRGRGSERPEGAMVYQMVVTRNGHVAGTELMSTRMRGDDLQRCVEQAMGRLTFGVADRARPLYRLTVRLQFQIERMLPAEPPV